MVYVKIGKEGVFNTSLNCYLFLSHHYLVCLIDGKLILWYFEDAYPFILGFYNVRVVHLLIDCPCWFVHQSNLIVLVCDYDSVETWKNLKISNYFIYQKSPYFGCTATAANRKDSYRLLSTAQVKLVLFIRVFKVLNLVNMWKFVEFRHDEAFIVKIDLISSNDADARQRDNLEHQINLKFIGVYV